MKINFDTADCVPSARTLLIIVLWIIAAVLIFHLGEMCGQARAFRSMRGGPQMQRHFNVRVPSPMDGYDQGFVTTGSARLQDDGGQGGPNVIYYRAQ
jgi:hypothetical protein